MVITSIKNNKNIFLSLGAFLFFICFGVWMTFPLLFHLGDFANGEYVIAWILNWNIHSILSGNIFHLFNANIFHPYKNTLAYSDLLFTSSIIALPFYLIFHEPMVPSNITFLSSLILLGFCTYLLSFILTKHFSLSILSGILVMCSPTVLDKRVHLQIISIWFVPLSLYFFYMYLQKRRYKFFLCTLLCFYLQTINNFMAGYFILIGISVIGGYEIFHAKIKIKKIFDKKFIIPISITLFSLIPIILPYISVSHEFHFVRDIREAIHLSLQPEDLFVGNDQTRLQPILEKIQNPSMYPVNAELKPGYVGFVFTLLSIFSSFGWIFKKKKASKYLSVFLLIGYIGLILSFGPALHIDRKTIHHPFLIPLPYAVMYYILPGFQGFRNVARFEMLFVLAMAVSSCLFLANFYKKKSKMFQSIITVILILCVVIEFHFPMQFPKAQTFQQFPSVYKWIANNTPKDSVILETPIYNWDNNPFGDNREVLREYYSTLHFRNLVSGGSGFSPPPWQQFAIDSFRDFPSPLIIEKIKKLGVTYIIVHKDEFDILSQNGYAHNSPVVSNGDSIIAELKERKSVKLITIQHFAYVYKIQ